MRRKRIRLVIWKEVAELTMNITLAVINEKQVQRRRCPFPLSAAPSSSRSHKKVVGESAVLMRYGSDQVGRVHVKLIGSDEAGCAGSAEVALRARIPLPIGQP